MSHPLRMRGLKLIGTVWEMRLISVASFTDAWIETIRNKIKKNCCTSHPLRMRGLKPFALRWTCYARQSHPLRMRGLKLISGKISIPWDLSHPLRMRGLKQLTRSECVGLNYVASFTDAWIETNKAA